ncbi:MAG: hypothetical protein K0S76_143 [Herbinix sp.]|jgi:hypothetical protein|nr:hypothetical protein [Herbinix sp.]
MSQVYNYLIESYQPNREINYRVNNRNELKRVYNNIVNLSKRSPLYKINLSKENQDYTIGIKETALVIQSKIGIMTDPSVSGFKTKATTVSNQEVLSAVLMKEDTDLLPELISISVQGLALAQVNKGRELFLPSRGLPSGSYEFRANVLDKSYRLSFNQTDRLENKDTIHNMADFLNESLPGITATVEQGSRQEYSKLVLTSDYMGRSGERTFSFAEQDFFQESIIEFFGLNRMEQTPSSAEFELNGMKKQTASNTFSIENTLQITLHRTSEEPIGIRIVPDKLQVMKGVDSFLHTFNGLIHIAKERMSEVEEHFGATKLLNEIKGLEKLYKEELESCGLKVMEDGRIDIEEALAVQASEDGGMESLFTRENGFIAKVREKAEAITINPMEYLDKTVVTYPDLTKTAYANPYMTSMYSGMLFNSYC